MIINAIELLDSAIKVKLSVPGMDRGGMNLPSPSIFRYKVWRSLDLHFSLFTLLLWKKKKNMTQQLNVNKPNT